MDSRASWKNSGRVFEYFRRSPGGSAVQERWSGGRGYEYGVIDSGSFGSTSNASCSLSQMRLWKVERGEGVGRVHAFIARRSSECSGIASRGI